MFTFLRAFSALYCLFGFCFFVDAAANARSEIRYEHVLEDGQLSYQVTIQDPQSFRYKSDSKNSLKFKTKINTLNAGKNRIHVVYIGDGYTQQEMQQYRDDVKNQMQAFLEQEPFKTYQNYFSFHIIETPSQDSGVGDSADNLKKTAFDMHYNCGGIDRLLCINVAKVNKVLQQLPKADIVFALANSEKYGGAGYLNQGIATLAARNKSSFELAFHEIGHSFGKLIDEYENSDGSANCNSFANASSVDRHEMEAKKTKWYRWLDLSHISTFKGGCYSQNYFRPTENSKMRSLKRPFEEVNIEQFVKRIYEKVKLTENLKTDKQHGGHITIEAILMKPNEHNLNVHWYLDEQEIIGFRNQAVIDTRQFDIKKAKAVIKLQIQDKTKLVRDEDFRKLHMTETYRWNIQLN